LRDLDRPNLLGALFSRFEARPDPEAPAAPAGETAASARPAAGGAAAADPGSAPREGQGDVAVIGSAEAPTPTPDAPAPAPEPAAPVAQAPAAAEPATAERSSEERGAARRERFRRGLEQFDTIAAAQQARALASRSALIGQAKLEPAQVAELDHTVKDMNDKLTGYGEEVIDQMTSETAPSASDTLGLGHDVSGILFEGQQKIDSLVGDKAPDVDVSAREIWNYVDLEQWRPFAQQKLAQTPAPAGKTPAGATPAAPAPAPANPGAAGTSGAKP